MSSARRDARIAFLAWLAVVAVLWTAALFGVALSVVDVVVGALLMLLPLWLGRRRSLGLELSEWRRSLFVFVALSLATLPAYVLLRPSPTDNGSATILVGALLVALPEELFFRGYLQACWGGVGKRRVRLLGAAVGWEWPATAACFALSHLTHGGPAGLLTFFPGLLFGWAYARTGSIWAGVLYHGTCNAVAWALG